MNYTVEVGNRTFVVEIRGDEIRVNGRWQEATLVAIPATPLRQLVIGARSRTFALTRDGERWVVQWAGERVAATVLDERSRRLREMAGMGTRPAEGAVVTAPMPGLVLRVQVEVGQRVDGGTGLVVLEAMKMENEIMAPSPGVVRAIHVEAGQPVEKGVPLMEIGPVEG